MKDKTAGTMQGNSTISLSEEQDLRRRYEKYKSIIKRLTIMSDIFMRNVFQKKECVEHVLQVIMGKKDLRILEQVVQMDFKNLQGRSAILDCVARDTENRRFDVEIQQDNEGASPKRARYHSGLLDMHTLKPGQDYDELPESYVIFITGEDVMGYGRPIYHIRRTIDEVRKEFGDESNIIYVNTQIQENTDLGQLSHDLTCRRAEDMYNKVLAERVRELKETEEEVERMCREMDQIYSEGMELGERKAKRETVLSLYGMGLPIEAIAQAVKVSTSLARQWILEGAEKNRTNA